MPIYRKKPVEVEAHYIPYSVEKIPFVIIQWLMENGAKRVDEPDDMEAIFIAFDWGHVRIRRGRFIFIDEDGVLTSQESDSFLEEFTEMVGDE